MATKAYSSAKAGYAPFNPEPMFHKTKLCKFYTRGACLRGSRCVFAHGKKELTAPPDFLRTSLCPAFVSSGFCDDAKCKFAHREEELRPRVAERDFHTNLMSAVDAKTATQPAVKVERSVPPKNHWSLQSTEPTLFDDLTSPLEKHWSQHSTESTLFGDFTSPLEKHWSQHSTESTLVPVQDMDDSGDEEEWNFRSEAASGSCWSRQTSVEKEWIPSASSDEDRAASDLSVAAGPHPHLPSTPSLVVKNTFIDGTEDQSPQPILRKVRSSPQLLAHH